MAARGQVGEQQVRHLTTLRALDSDRMVSYRAIDVRAIDAISSDVTTRWLPGALCFCDTVKGGLDRLLNT
jgi:hypothetical protein